MEILANLIFYLEYIFWFVLVFSIIVFIHEFGHFYIARLNHVKVEKFSIGFGPTIFKYVDKNKTIWQICYVPLGGYVKFAGEMYPDNSRKNSKTKSNVLFMNKTALQKASIVLAGPVANFVLGIFLFIIIFTIFGKNNTSPVIGNIEKGSPSEKAGMLKYDKILAINGKEVNSFEEISELIDESKSNTIDFLIIRDSKNTNIIVSPEKKIIKTFIGSEREINYVGFEANLYPIVKKVIKNSPAYIAGIKPKDKILKINNVITSDIREVIAIVEKSANKKLNFLVLRDDQQIEIPITPQHLDNSGSVKEKAVIGVMFSREKVKVNLFDAIKEASKNFIVICVKTLEAFIEIIFGKRDHCEVGGPILIAKVSNDIASKDIVSFLSLIALISINLGLINLFPLPLLDGGHFFTYMYEFIYKKHVTKNFYKYFQGVGVIIIFSLMFFSIFNDIYCRVLN